MTAHPVTRTGADTVTDVFSELRMNSGAREVSGRGKSSLAQRVTMAYRFDITSYYVAIGIGRGPFPTRLIDRLTERP